MQDDGTDRGRDCRRVCKIDVDQEPELARQYRVMSIPTFLVFKDGEVVKRDMGVMSKDELKGLIV